MFYWCPIFIHQNYKYIIWICFIFIHISTIIKLHIQSVCHIKTFENILNIQFSPTSLSKWYILQDIYTCVICWLIYLILKTGFYVEINAIGHRFTIFPYIVHQQTGLGWHFGCQRKPDCENGKCVPIFWLVAALFQILC